MRKGVKARPHDVAEIMEIFKPEVVEIHASSEDLDKKIEGKHDAILVVHFPEYQGTELIDASSVDEAARLRAQKFYARALTVTREWGAHFRGLPKAIMHPGGWSNEPVKPWEKQFLYNNLKKTMTELNASGVDLMVENMPPQPWFYGGQWHCNIMLDPVECRDYCIGNGWGFCLDLCHAFLYCNFIKEVTIHEFMRKVRPIIGHMHISDARGVDGEGLQIGEGEMPLKEILEYIAPLNVPLVPEIWLGHRDGFAGFKTAWERIESLLPVAV